jgi:hypothetical protein
VGYDARDEKLTGEQLLIRHPHLGTISPT